MSGVYEGFRILDFTQGIAGSMACMLLADFDAEVIKIDPPGGGALEDHPGALCWDRNKLRLALNLHGQDGLRSARELIASADVAVFDGAPGELERLGLDGTTVLADNPALIHAWLPPYGTAGRWSQLPAEHDLLTALTGAAHTQFSHGSDQPIHLTTPQLAYNHGLTAANAISAALYERGHSGRGQAVTVSGLHGASAALSGSAIHTATMMRMGAGSPRGAAPNYRLYECADGQWFFLATLFAQFFFKALEATDLLDLLAEESIGGEFMNLMRPPGNAIAGARLDARFREKPRAEWLQILKAAGVPCGPVGDRESWFAGETVAANEMRIELEHPRLGTVAMPGVSAKLSATPGSVRHLAQQVKLAEIAPHVPRVAAETTAEASEPGGALAGVRVLDLGVVIAGTYSAAILANFGADVIKVEPPGGDSFRPYGLGFIGYNQGKRGLCLDLKQPAGRELFFDLVRRADVVIDNYRLGVRERLGISYETLRAINPRIVSCSVTGYGPAGPMATDPGFDPLLQAQGGLMAAQGGEGEPVFYQIPVNDVSTAGMAAFGVIAALQARERTGEGQEVLTALVNQSVMFQSGELTWYKGRPPAEVGAGDCVGVSALHRFYRCADGWVAIVCSRAEQFHQLCIALGHPEWAGRYVAEQAMQQPAEGELAGLIAAAFEELPRAEALDRLLSTGVGAAPALRSEELFSDPWLWANGFFESYTYPPYDTVTSVRGFAEWSRSRGGFARHTPALGQHSREVLAEIGIDPAQIDELIASGVVKQG